MDNIFLLIDTGTKEPRVLYVVNNINKAESWRELLMEQGKDVIVVILDSGNADKINSFLLK